ncbi:MAG: hypothetical protein K2Q14_07195, partial [Gammaproteobacteria bacterium]|nr:hypothetical protein [Gammaproteobacteria bacterium]
EEIKLLRDIERVIKQAIPREKVDGFHPNPSAPATPPPTYSRRPTTANRNTGRGQAADKRKRGS